MPFTWLILVRHGQAEAHSASREDFDRALTPQGRLDAAETGRRLAEAGFVPDLVLVSEAMRASQTWAEMAPALPATALEIQRALYNASAADLLTAAEEADSASVAVVAHNPGLHELALHLAGGGRTDAALARRLERSFPPGCAAVFRFEAGRPVCQTFFTP